MRKSQTREGTQPFQRRPEGRGNGVCVLALGLMVTGGLLVTAEAVLAGDGAAEALSLRLRAEGAIAEEAARGDAELAAVMREILPGLLVEDLVTRDETVALDTVDAAFVEEQFDVAAAMEEPGVAMALAVFAGPGTGYEHNVRTALAALADFDVKDTLPQGKREGNNGFERAAGVLERAAEVQERILARQLEHLERRDAALDAKAANTTVDRFTLTVKTEGVTLTVTPSQLVQVESRGAEVTVTPGEGPAQVDPVNGNGPGNANSNGTTNFSDPPGNSGGNGGGPPPGKGKP